MKQRKIVCLALPLMALSLFACARLGTSTSVMAPEAMSSIRVLGLAPIQVDSFVLSDCRNAAQIAETAILKANERASAFTIVPVDTLLAHVAPGGLLCGRDLLAAAERLGLDGILICDVMAEEPFTRGVLFDNTGIDRTGSYDAVVYMQVVKSATHEPLVIARFGTRWGVSYFSTPKGEQAVADAVDRAFQSIAKLQKN